MLQTAARRRTGASAAGLCAAIGGALVLGVASGPATGTPPQHPQATGDRTAPRAGSDGAALPDGARELEGLRTETTRTWQLENGDQVLRTYAGPVNFRRGGRFTTIDSDLVAAPGAAAYRTERSAFESALPADAADPVRISGGDDWIEFGIVGAKGRGERTADDTVRYASALPGVSVDLQSTATGLKEALVLADRRATSAFEYRVRLSAGLRAVPTDDGRIQFRRGDEVVFAFEPPFVSDDAGTVATGKDAVEYDLRRAGDELRVGVALDEGWLNAPQRRFPVVLDPTTSYVNGWAVLKQTLQETFMQSDQPTTRQDHLSYLRAGKDTTSRFHKPLLKFDLSGIPDESIVLSADFGVYLLSKLNTEAAQLHVHEVAKSWTTAATWNSPDGTNSWAGGANGAFTSASALPTSGWLVWRDLRPLAQRWLDGTTPNHGVMIDECCDTPLNRYDFAKSTAPADQVPYMQVRYEQRAGTLPTYSFWRPDQAVVSGDEPDIGGSRGLPPVAVNLASGNLVLNEVDRAANLSATGNMPIGRTYNSNWWGTWSHGRGWTNNDSAVDIALQSQPDGSVSLRGPTNSVLRFTKQSNGTYANAEQTDASLKLNATNGEYTVTFNETGEQFVFPGIDRVLRRHVDSAGQTTTWTFTTDAAGQAIDGTATDPAGRWTKWFFEYTAGHRRTSRIETQDGKIYRYAYDAEDNLVSFTAPDGKVTRYEWEPAYTGGGKVRLNKIIRPDGSSVIVTYTTFNFQRAVASYTTRAPGATVDGPTTRFAYSRPSATTGRTTVTAPGGTVSTFDWDRTRRVTAMSTGANAPTVGIAGTLVDNQDKTLATNGSYTLSVTGQDGTSTAPSQGVKSIEMLVDGERIAFSEQACTAGSCSMSRSITVRTDDLEQGRHVLDAVVIDHGGARTVRTVRFAVDHGDAEDISAIPAGDPGPLDPDPPDTDPADNPADEGTVPLSFRLRCLAGDVMREEHYEWDGDELAAPALTPQAAFEAWLADPSVPLIPKTGWTISFNEPTAVTYDLVQNGRLVAIVDLFQEGDSWGTEGWAACGDVYGE